MGLGSKRRGLKALASRSESEGQMTLLEYYVAAHFRHTGYRKASRFAQKLSRLYGCRLDETIWAAAL